MWISIKEQASSERWAVLDIDGCISDDEWRQEDLPKASPLGTPCSNPAAYDSYNDGMAADAPMNLLVVHWLVARGYGLIFCTARPSKYRQHTINWLETFLPIKKTDCILMMRPEGDARPSPELKLELVETAIYSQALEWDCVHYAFDDREDVLRAYPSTVPCKMQLKKGNGASVLELLNSSESVELVFNPAKSKSTDEILSEMSATFKERNKVYGDNYKRVGDVMEILHGDNSAFPAKELVGTAEQFNVWHLYELLIVKVTRFANSGLTHADSIHDAAVYAAMIESLITKGK